MGSKIYEKYMSINTPFWLLVALKVRVMRQCGDISLSSNVRKCNMRGF
jgi:hypothetical protein